MEGPPRAGEHRGPGTMGGRVPAPTPRGAGEGGAGVQAGVPRRGGGHRGPGAAGEDPAGAVALPPERAFSPSSTKCGTRWPRPCQNWQPSSRAERVPPRRASTGAGGRKPPDFARRHCSSFVPATCNESADADADAFRARRAGGPRRGDKGGASRETQTRGRATHLAPGSVRRARRRETGAGGQGRDVDAAGGPGLHGPDQHVRAWVRKQR